MVNLINDDSIGQCALPIETPTQNMPSEPDKDESESKPLTQYEKTKLALEKWKKTSDLYNERKALADYKKSSLLIRTNWKEALPEHSRPSVDDKKAYVREETYDDRKSLAVLWTEKEFLKELYELEKIRYEKEGDVIDG